MVGAIVALGSVTFGANYKRKKQVAKQARHIGIKSSNWLQHGSQHLQVCRISGVLFLCFAASLLGWVSDGFSKGFGIKFSIRFLILFDGTINIVEDRTF